MGYYARLQHELLLIACRGDLPPPHERHRPASIFSAPRSKHSEKPERFYEIIEAAYPDVPRIELYARNTRSGWSSWGNEVTHAR